MCMRNQLLTVVLIAMGTFTIHAQKDPKKPKAYRFETHPNYKKESKIELKYVETWFSYIPASSYHTEDDRIVSAKEFYMMKFEVPNMLYKLFINDLKAKGKSDELKISIPDTTAWGTKNQPYIDYYFQHPKFNTYPVVSVPREGVKLFCAWLEEQVKTLMLKEWKNKTVKFRLPTEVEWMIAASGGDSNAVYAWKGIDMQMGPGPWGGDYMANFRRVGDSDILRGEDGKLMVKKNASKKYQNYFGPVGSADITAPVNNYWGNAYGLYCMTGNVREMVQEEGFTKGGGYIDPGGECMIDFRNTYQKEGYPCEGFRIIAVVE
jgi:sulfatase modifying factor 1